MRLTYALPVVLLAIGCDGGTNTNDDQNPTDATDTGPDRIELTFKSVVPATEFVANISENVVQAHQMTNALLAGMGVVSADAAVRGMRKTPGRGRRARRTFSKLTPGFALKNFST